MLYWKNLSPGKQVPEKLNAIIEYPKGSKNKYELSKNANILLLDRILHSSVVYPTDYGLIPGTYADDGDPLDILVLTTNATEPLTVIECKPIGVLIMEDEKGGDEKILATPLKDPYYRDFDEIDDLPGHYLDEIMEFFRTYKNLEEPKYAHVKEWKNKSYSYEIIVNSITQFNEKFGNIERIGI